MNFECKKCGKCCSNLLPLTQKEIETMRKLKDKINKMPLKKDYEHDCPFLGNDNKCNIYNDRPFICRQYDCYKFKNHIFSPIVFEKVKKEKFMLTNVRESIL